MQLPLQSQTQAPDQVRREVEIGATPEEVWEALVTEEGREAWLEPDPDREVHVEAVEAPHRLVWWWWHAEEPPRRVEVHVIAVARGSRVIVTETAPHFPLARLSASFALLAA